MRDSNVPESLDGWWVLHRMFAFDRHGWDGLPEKRRVKYGSHAGDLFEHLQSGKDGDVALAQLVGHRGDLMLTHYARSYDGLAYAQTLVDKLEFREYLEPVGSYVSLVEVDVYAAGGDANRNIASRLWAKIPRSRYVSFFTMNRRRSGSDDWYRLPFEERARLAAEYDRIVRSEPAVTPVVSGSTGFDAYDCGIDLYSDDAAAFKRLLRSLRYGDSSLRYADFGPAWSGVQFSSHDLRVFLDGDAVPALDPDV